MIHIHRANITRELSRQAFRFFNRVDTEMALGADYKTAYDVAKAGWPADKGWQPF